MAKKLKFYRGPKTSMPTLSEGEPGYTTDEKKLYVGDGTENIGIVKDEDIADMVTTVGGASIDMPEGVTGPVQIIFTEEEDDETGGSLYVAITGSDGTYASDHSAQEIYEAYQADKAVFAKIGENIVPLTHVSLSGSTYSAQFNVLSGIEGYQNILITQSGETKHVYVTDNQLSATLTFGAQAVATTAWTSDATYSDQGYGFRASAPLSGVTTSHIPDVTFAMADAISGNLAPLADTYDGGLYIYAKEQPTATVNIASVVCTKGA